MSDYDALNIKTESLKEAEDLIFKHNERIAALDRHRIPHNMGDIDMDAWAERFDAVIDNNELVQNVNGHERRAVAYSPGYGAGWSTWNSDIISPVDARNNLFVLTVKECYDTVSSGVLSGVKEEVEDLFYLTHPEIDEEENYVSLHGLDKTFIEWIDRSRKFIIDEYDGYESLSFADEINWF